MTRTIINPRVWAVVALATITVATFFAEPTATATGRWLALFFTTKVAAVAAAYTTYTLARRWTKAGKLGRLGEALTRCEE